MHAAAGCISCEGIGLIDYDYGNNDPRNCFAPCILCFRRDQWTLAANDAWHSMMTTVRPAQPKKPKPPHIAAREEKRATG